MSDETKIAQLVERCLALEADGAEQIPFDEVCADHPGLREAVEQAFRVTGDISKVGAEAFRSDARLGTIVADRYRLTERLGAGAMGVVYGATDLDLSRAVAIKLMRTDLLVKDSTVTRFEREATTLAAIQHEAVVAIHDRGITEDGTPYLVMELVQGVSCSKILEEAQARSTALKRGGAGASDFDDSSWLTEAFGIETLEEPSFLRQVVRWAADVATGLGVAHAVGVVHRDLKPSNIIIKPNGRAVLIDFGIASAPGLGTLTADDEVVGTPAYMAPEALKGSAQLGPEADVYGLAATLYHLITLQAPFEGSLNEVLNAVATREPTPACRVRPGIPRAVEAILDHGMARVAGSRYATLSAMEQDLRALLAHRPVSVSPTSNLVRFTRRLRRSKAIKGAMCAAILILGPLGFQGWRAAAAAETNDRYQALWGQVPGNLGVLKNANRFVPQPEIRAEILGLLDRLVSNGEAIETALSLRGVFRFDQGDGAGAAADFKELASRVPGPVARTLADAYAQAQEHPENEFVLGQLPAPETQTELYLAVLHFMRARDMPKIQRALGDPRLNGHRHGEELRFLMRVVSLDPMWKDRRWKDLRDAAPRIAFDAATFAEDTGFESAMVAHAIGTPLLRLGRYGEALDAFQEGLATSPYSLGLLQNAAESALGGNQYDLALGYIERARARAPKHLPLHQIHANVLIGLGRTSEARKVIQAADYGDSAIGQRRRNGQLLKIVVAEAAVLGPDDTKQMIDLRKEADGLCSVLNPKSRARTTTMLQLDALATGDKRPVFRDALERLLVEPTSYFRFFEMLRAHQLPLNEDDQALLFDWFERLAENYELLSAPQRIR